MWSSILNEVVTVLNTISSLQEVHNYEKSTFGGYPAVTVTPNEEESDFEATTERMRVYSFNVRLFQETYSQQQPDSPKIGNADEILRDAVDDVIAEFDKPTNARLSGNADTTAEKVVNVLPVPSAWAHDTDRNLRIATINLNVQVYVDTNNL